MARRRRRREEHANHERWLVSYADFITLLFAFFVTMYAISQVDAKKLGQLVDSMHSAFDSRVFEARSDKLNLADGITRGIDQQKLVEPISPPMIDPAFKRIREAVEQRLIRDKSIDKVHFTLDRRGLVISLTEAGFFDPGHAELKGSSLAILDVIAQSVLTLPNQLRVEGHTDTTPINTPRFPSNWELSTARATYVISYLTTHFPFSPRRLSAAGYGEYRPIASNATAEGRALNRRVDLIVLSEAAERQEPR
ncbi:MAG: flagellar motor protein MotB [Acidobacteriota bacterium]